MSVSRHHAEWLALVESSGPFLSLPVLMRVFPQGLDPRNSQQAKQLRLVYEEWQEKPNLAGKQRAWIAHVLTHVLLYPEELLVEGQALPPGLTANMAEHGESLRPDFALLGPAGNDLAGKPQLLISLYGPEQALDKPVTGKHWKATPSTRMMELLHAADVPLGLVTNGERWMLVFAPRGETTGFTSWLASLWIDEPVTLRAFHSLLSTRRFFGVKPSDTLSSLFQESSKDQQEVTNQLGDQVRDAVDVLIQAFDRLDQDSGRTLLKGLDEKSLYDAALTVMMRLVFLFSAEERGLLHLGERIYDDNYAVSTLREQLQEVADRYGEEVLERRNDAWARLLATFRAVHAGVSHQDLMLPAYGGSLFDPDRYPFLEGRAQGTGWQTSPAAPLEINNRVALHLLKSLQMLQVKVPGGGPAEARRVSFVALDIEQIGHIYEGLLDHTAVRAKEVVLGLAASRKKPVASMALLDLEKLQQQDEKKLIEALEEETDRSAKTLAKVLKTEIPAEESHRVLIACAQDQKLADRVLPFRGLLRQDSFERLVVVLPGGIYVGQGSARRSTGTHYTPRSLTEPIVQYTLEPLVYRGPAEGLPKEQWRLRSPKEILDLKICDMAMGSGAFLVQTCRYLSERLVEAWENLEKEHPGEVLITPEGGFSQGEPRERLIPKEAVERLAIGRRLVADRCLYGVDINPMAVEMAKLSIWLITVDKSRPFTFLDHALKYGDSLLGICRFKQLETFSLEDEQTKQVVILANYDELIRTAITKRRELEQLSSNDDAQIATKQILLIEAENCLEHLKLAADILIAAELAEGKEQKKDMNRAAAHIRVAQYIHKQLPEFRNFAHEQLRGRPTFHWPLEFPEIFDQDGFDAVVGNPPFQGGYLIGLSLGGDYRNYLGRYLANGTKGSADLCAFFFLRAMHLLNFTGIAGLLATNTIAQGDTRDVGLAQITGKGTHVIRAVSSKKWPGSAALEVAHVWLTKSEWRGSRILDEAEVRGISPRLTDAGHVSGNPYRLAANTGKAFKGTTTGCVGFVLEPDEAETLMKKDSRNREVIVPFLSGEDFNSRPDQSPSRYVVDFRDWDLERAGSYKDCLQLLYERVKPHRDAQTGQIHESDYWKFSDKRLESYESISHLKRVLFHSFTSKYLCFGFVPTKIIYSAPHAVVGLDSGRDFALLQSAFHEIWVFAHCSTMETRLRYAPSDLFDTFPFPNECSQSRGQLDELGNQYDACRIRIMTTRIEGLTKLYNRFHDPGEPSSDIADLRCLHVDLDKAVATAYGWNDIDLGHDFHETKQGVRYTFSDFARRVVLDRLLVLNQSRYEEEVGAGLHAKKTKAPGKGDSGKSKLKGTAGQGVLY